MLSTSRTLSSSQEETSTRASSIFRKKGGKMVVIIIGLLLVVFMVFLQLGYEGKSGQWKNRIAATTTAAVYTLRPRGPEPQVHQGVAKKPRVQHGSDGNKTKTPSKPTVGQGPSSSHSPQRTATLTEANSSPLAVRNSSSDPMPQVTNNSSNSPEVQESKQETLSPDSTTAIPANVITPTTPPPTTPPPTLDCTYHPEVERLMKGIHQGTFFIMHDCDGNQDPLMRYPTPDPHHDYRVRALEKWVGDAIKYRHEIYKKERLKVWSQNGTLIPAIDAYPAVYYLVGAGDETFSVGQQQDHGISLMREVLQAVKNLYILDWNPNYLSDAGFTHLRMVPMPDYDVFQWGFDGDPIFVDWIPTREKGPYAVAFRGASTGFPPPNSDGCAMIDRARVVRKFLNVPNTSVKISNVVQDCEFPKRYMGSSMTHDDMAKKAKVLLDVDGNANAWSALRWKLAAGCVVKVASLFIQWHYQWLEHGKNVYMLDIDSPTFVEEVMALADDPDRCDAMSKRSREHASAIVTKRSGFRFLNEAVAHVVERYPDSLYEKPFVFSVRNYTWKPRMLPSKSPTT